MGHTIAERAVTAENAEISQCAARRKIAATPRRGQHYGVEAIEHRLGHQPVRASGAAIGIRCARANSATRSMILPWARNQGAMTSRVAPRSLSSSTASARVGCGPVANAVVAVQRVVRVSSWATDSVRALACRARRAHRGDEHADVGIEPRYARHVRAAGEAHGSAGRPRRARRPGARRSPDSAIIAGMSTRA